MQDQDVIEHINKLVAEEHALLEQAATGQPAPDEHQRLEDLQVALDQLWDLLRQRRARREMGRDPDAAHERDPKIVEKYQQ